MYFCILFHLSRLRLLEERGNFSLNGNPGSCDFSSGSLGRMRNLQGVMGDAQPLFHCCPLDYFFPSGKVCQQTEKLTTVGAPSILPVISETAPCALISSDHPD